MLSLLLGEYIWSWALIKVGLVLEMDLLQIFLAFSLFSTGGKLYWTYRTSSYLLILNDTHISEALEGFKSIEVTKKEPILHWFLSKFFCEFRLETIASMFPQRESGHLLDPAPVDLKQIWLTKSARKLELNWHSWTVLKPWLCKRFPVSIQNRIANNVITLDFRVQDKWDSKQCWTIGCQRSWRSIRKLCVSERWWDLLWKLCKLTISNETICLIQKHPL